MPLISEIVGEIYPTSQYLCQIDITKKGLFGGGVDNNLPQKIYNIGRSVNKRYLTDPSDTSLQFTANYLYALCGKYGMQAQAILGSNGSIAGIVPTVTQQPEPLDWIITADSTPLADGGTSVTLIQFIGYDINFIRGSLTQYTTNPGDGSTYYSWSKTSGLFTISSAASLGEQMRIFI